MVLTTSWYFDLAAGANVDRLGFVVTRRRLHKCFSAIFKLKNLARSVARAQTS